MLEALAAHGTGAQLRVYRAKRQRWVTGSRRQNGTGLREDMALGYRLHPLA